METNSKPKILKSILCVIPSALIYIIIDFAAIFALSFLTVILSKIPIISNIIGFLFRIRGDSPNFLIPIISVISAYLLTTFVQKRMMREYNTLKLSRIVLGALIIAANVAFLVINIIAKSSLVANIVNIICGLAFILDNNQ